LLIGPATEESRLSVTRYALEMYNLKAKQMKKESRMNNNYKCICAVSYLLEDE